MSWGSAPTATTKHTCNEGRGPAFGRKTVGCPRCDELLAGAAPVKWATSQRAEDDARRAREIRAHDCARSRCAVVCTFGDW